MFQGSLYPSSGALDRMLLHVVFSTRCAGWSLWNPASTVCTRPASRFPKTPANTSSAENHMQNIDLALLKRGIMMPETCWANGLLINHNLLHLVGLTRHFILRMHGHTNIKEVNSKVNFVLNLPSHYDEGWGFGGIDQMLLTSSLHRG